MKLEALAARTETWIDGKNDLVTPFPVLIDKAEVLLRDLLAYATSVSQERDAITFNNELAIKWGWRPDVAQLEHRRLQKKLDEAMELVGRWTEIVDDYKAQHELDRAELSTLRTRAAPRLSDEAVRALHSAYGRLIGVGRPACDQAADEIQALIVAATHPQETP